MPHFDLQAILQGDPDQFADIFATAASLTGQDVASLRHHLARDVYAQLTRAPHIDPALGLLFSRFEPAAIACIASDDTFYNQPDNTFRRNLSLLLSAASHWYARDTKPSQQFFARLQMALSAPEPSNPTAPLESTLAALDSLAHWLTSEQQRASLLEQRLCDTELATRKLALAHARVVKLINQSLAQRPLPLALHSPLASILQTELQYWASNTPPADLASLPLWVHWQRILPLLGQVFSHQDIQVEEQQLYSLIPALLAELERSLAHSLNNAPAYQQWVELLSQSLMMAIQQQPQDTGLFAPLPLPDGHSGITAKVPLTLLQATEGIKQGDWILLRGNDQAPIRCKLLLKNADVDQLLFVDHTGRKVMTKTNKEFALWLSTGIAQPLQTPSVADAIEPVLGAFIADLNQRLRAQLHQQKQKAEALMQAFKAEQQALAEQAERERHAELARQQAEAEARQAAARKARAEAQRLADEHQRRAAEKAAALERQLQEAEKARVAEAEAREESVRHTLDTLQVGAWVDMFTAEGSPMRAKLSVIISATGKYIFADQVGRKIAEFTRTDLIDQLRAGTLKVVRNGDNFEDQLAKVIRSLRRDLH